MLKLEAVQSIFKPWAHQKHCVPLDSHSSHKRT